MVSEVGTVSAWHIGDVPSSEMLGRGWDGRSPDLREPLEGLPSHRLGAGLSTCCLTWGSPSTADCPPDEELTFVLRVFREGSMKRCDSVKLFQSTFVS